MATPSITLLTPAFGHTGGREMVRLDGTGFRLPAPPPSSGPVPAAAPTVRVELNGKAALRVLVVSSSLLYFVSPIQDPGLQTVVLRNLDDDGVPIPGEVATRVDGFEFRLPPLTGAANESVLSRVCRHLIQEVKRQVLPNTVLTVSVDYDPEVEDAKNYINAATLPALGFIGPGLQRNRVNSTNVRGEERPSSVEFLQRRPPRTHDATFQVVGMADSTLTLLNLMAAFQLFVDRNPYLEMLRDAADASKGVVRYEFDFAPGGDLQATGAAEASDLRSFRGTVYVRGIELASMAGFGDDTVVDRGAPLTEGVTLDPAEQA